MSERSISSLPYERLEEICEIAEDAARKYITSKLPKKAVSDLTISVDLELSETLNVNVDVEVTLSPLYRNVNVKEIAEGSVKAAFEAVERYLKKIQI